MDGKPVIEVRLADSPPPANWLGVFIWQDGSFRASPGALQVLIQDPKALKVEGPRRYSQASLCALAAIVGILSAVHRVELNETSFDLPEAESLIPLIIGRAVELSNPIRLRKPLTLVELARQDMARETSVAF